MWDYFVESIVWTFCEPIFIVDSAGASPTFQFQSFERGSRDAARIFEFALGCNAKRHRSLRSFSFPPLKLEEKHRLLFLSRATNAGINAHAHLQGLGAPPSNRPNLPQVPAIETHVWLRDWANSLRPRTDGLLQSDAHFRARTLPRPLTTFADDRRWQAILAAHREPLEALVDQYDLWDSHAAASRAEQWVKHALDRLTPNDRLRRSPSVSGIPASPAFQPEQPLSQRRTAICC